MLLINDPSITLTKDVLRGQNEQGGEKNIAVGYHAIEFLLWGQDDVDPTKKTAGARSFEDYVAGSTTAKNQDRRGQYLRLLAEILVEDLTTVTAAWEPNKDNYARSFVADPKVAVTRILTGMGSLANAELSGERMTVAYKNKGQEDEHSCFSDTTNADLQGNFRGLEDAYLGSYEASAGVGIDRLVAAVDPALDAKVKTDLAAAAAAFGVLQAVPFDLAIQSAEGTPERQAVLTAIEAVKVLARDVEAVGAKLGVTFALEKPSEDL